MRHKIELIAIDQDGTLFDSAGRLPARNVWAMQQALARGVGIILATGKSRTSAAPVMAALGLGLGGVFTQGLVLYDAAGAVLAETGLEPQTAVAVITFAEENSLPVFVYCGERLLTPVETPYRPLLCHHFHEPEPEVVGSLVDWVGKITMNKLLISDEIHNAQTRAALEGLVGKTAVVTQAVPQFLEVLPPGASKGAGLARLLCHLKVAPQAVMAIGDGENDLEMLRMVGLGVAMGNAATAVQAAADYVVASNDEGGVAEAIERFVLI